MKIKFRQTKAGHCTVYCYANIFNDSDFLTYLNDDAYKGRGEEQENKMLDDLNKDIKVSSVVSVQQNFMMLPKNYVYDLIKSKPDGEVLPDGEGELPVVAYLLTVRLVESMWHHVAILKHKNQLFYLDPYRENLIRIENASDLDLLFIDCCRIDRHTTKESDQYVYLKGEHLGYEWLNEYCE